MANGLAITCIPFSSWPYDSILGIPGAKSTFKSGFKSGLMVRAASATCRPFMPPGRPTHVGYEQIYLRGGLPNSHPGRPPKPGLSAITYHYGHLTDHPHAQASD